VRPINKVILHCSATKEGMHIDVDTIRMWHLERGWKDIGYHYVIYLDGTIALGRPIDLIGAHTKGENEDSIGICYVGGLSAKTNEPQDTMTVHQEMAFLELWHGLQTVLGKLDLFGHNDFSDKACPSFDTREKYKFLLND